MAFGVEEMVHSRGQHSSCEGTVKRAGSGSSVSALAPAFGSSRNKQLWPCSEKVSLMACTLEVIAYSCVMKNSF